MRNIEIAKITGLSESSVCKILRGDKSFSKENIILVHHYKNYEAVQIKDFFKDEKMEMMCNLIITEIRKNDYKDINKMLRYVVDCMNWYYILNNPNEYKIVSKTPANLFKDDMFFLMCDIAIKRCIDLELKKWILNLQNAHINLNKKLE